MRPPNSLAGAPAGTARPAIDQPVLDATAEEGVRKHWGSFSTAPAGPVRDVKSNRRRASEQQRPERAKRDRNPDAEGFAPQIMSPASDRATAPHDDADMRQPDARRERRLVDARPSPTPRRSATFGRTRRRRSRGRPAAGLARRWNSFAGIPPGMSRSFGIPGSSVETGPVSFPRNALGGSDIGAHGQSQQARGQVYAGLRDGRGAGSVK